MTGLAPDVQAAPESQRGELWDARGLCQSVLEEGLEPSRALRPIGF